MTSVKILSVRAESNNGVLQLDEEHGRVGVLGTIVLLSDSDRARTAKVRLPDGNPVEIAGARVTDAGIELIFHRPLPPGTRIQLEDDTILRLPDNALAR